MSASPLRLDFFLDVRNICVERLAHAGYKVGKLKGSSQRQCFEALLILDNVTRRRIEARPRRFEQSRALTSNVLSVHVVRALQRLRVAVTRGEDLNPWLSTKIDSALGRDQMLMDWGIHHLHLSTIETRVGHRARSVDLAFAVVRPNALRVLDVGVHDDIGDTRLLKIWLANWPAMLRPHRLNTVQGETLTPQEQRNLWANGLQTVVQLQDGAYSMMGGGLNTAAMSIAAVRTADITIHQIGAVQRSVTDRQAEYVAYLDAMTGRVPSTLDFHLSTDRDGRAFSVVECSSGMRFPVGFAL